MNATETNLDLNAIHNHTDVVDPSNEDDFTFNQLDARNMRLDEWKSTIEDKLQRLISIAAHLRNTISAAKTTVKKTYYGKKFKRINDEVIKLVSALQQIEQLKQKNAKTAEPTEHEDIQTTTAN